MTKSQAGRQKGGDNARRSLVKASIWRIFAISNTLVMAVSISKDLSIASKIAPTDAVFKTARMFAYEVLGWFCMGKGFLDRAKFRCTTACIARARFSHGARYRYLEMIP
jgi:hypothetical protein